jgi:hypothetical protein
MPPAFRRPGAGDAIADQLARARHAQADHEASKPRRRFSGGYGDGPLRPGSPAWRAQQAEGHEYHAPSSHSGNSESALRLRDLALRAILQLEEYSPMTAASFRSELKKIS